jgi:hypothetical protein
VNTYFVSYTTNSLELPTEGYNVFRVKENKAIHGNGKSVNILEIIVGGIKRDANRMSVHHLGHELVEGERAVFERLFTLF